MATFSTIRLNANKKLNILTYRTPYYFIKLYVFKNGPFFGSSCTLGISQSAFGYTLTA